MPRYPQLAGLAVGVLAACSDSSTSETTTSTTPSTSATTTDCADVTALADLLETAVSGLTTDKFTQKAPEITSALAEQGTATKALGTSISDNCVTE